MSKNICNSVHNIAFVTAGYIDRNDIVYAGLGFVIGLATGSSICAMM